MSMFHIKRPQVEEPRCVCTQPLLQTWSHRYFASPKRPTSAQSDWLSCQSVLALKTPDSWRGGVGPGLGEKETLQAGSCSSPSLLPFFFFLFPPNSHPVPTLLPKLYKALGLQWWFGPRTGFQGVTWGGESWKNPWHKWHALKLRNLAAWNSSL